ncbi:MAG: respiratory nitrate reductase subunit gamma [Candidatus Methanomethylicia archaeon]
MLPKLITIFLAYISIIIFISGIIIRLAKWYTKSRNIASYTLYPKSGFPSVILRITLFPRVFETNRLLWISGWIFHVSLILLLFGHLRLFQEPYWLWNILNLETYEDVSRFAFISGGITGVLFISPVFMLLARRMRGTLYKLSTFEDYFILLLLALIGLTGNYMRFMLHIDVPKLQQFFIGLLYLNPSPHQPTDPVFLVHMFLAELLLIYLPFSKLIHSISATILTYRFTR